MPMKKPSFAKLISGPRVAAILDLDPASIRRWRREGAPHHILDEGLIRYDIDEILAWRATRRPPVVQKKEVA
jgi:hypothetical protein